MKFTKYLLSAFLLLLTSSLIAQDIVPKDLSKTGSRDRVVFELNWNGWLNQSAADSITQINDSTSVNYSGVNTKWYGRGVNIYAFYDFKLGNQDFVSFGVGAGISNHNVYHRSEIVEIDTDTSSLVYDGLTVLLPIAEGRDVRTNKLSTTFFEVPMELRFRTKADKFGKRFKVNPGIRLGYLLNGHTKFRGDDANSREIKVKQYRLPNINRYRVSAALRVGYGNFSLVSAVSLTPLFEKDRGPGMLPISIGISFNSF